MSEDRSNTTDWRALRDAADREYQIAWNFVTDGGKHPDALICQISILELRRLLRRARVEERDRCAGLAPHAQLREDEHA